MQEIARQEAFLALPQLLLVELVRDDSLAVRSEVTVYEAVMGWVRSDAERRRGAIGEVLGAVRLGLLPAPFLAETVATDPLIEPSLDASRLLVKALSCHASSATRDGVDSGSLLRRRTRPADKRLMVIGGHSSDGEALASSECYDAQWQALPDMSGERDGCGGAVVEGLVYVVGGYRAGEPLSSAECYDPSTGDWRGVPDMSVARFDCAAACVDGLLYIVGGNPNFYGQPLASTECYDPFTRAWRALLDMTVKRYYCAAACVDGILYVVGGADDCRDYDSCLASAECYDPSAGEWRALPNMSVERKGCAAACIDGLLYVVGGYNGDYLASAECYDPSTGEWRAVPNMSVARYGCAAASIGGLLYVVGGNNGDDDSDVDEAPAVASVECYDPSTKQWKGLPDMSVARADFVAVALP
jgi:N-acetylneuraminic acid mutarotase